MMHRTCNWIVTACLVLIVFAVESVGAQETQQKNSTKKIRIQPSEFAAKCGSAVEWRPSVAKALEESAASGKPVFWYVPTIQGSFMDRKPVIDRYMMAGPFSWPAIIKLLNDNFIPVKAVADGSLQRQFKDIKRYKFVEPGFVVVNADGSVQSTIDQITTLDPYWISSVIAGWAGVETPSIWSDDLEPHVNRFRYRFRSSKTHEGEFGLHDPAFVERMLLTGMSQYRMGNYDKARQIWKSTSEHDDHPLAWKAMAEAEGWGPFVRGFENHQLLPDAAYRAGLDSRGSAAPKGIYTEAEIWQRSTAFLLSMQTRDGGWTDSDYDFGGSDSLPNVYAAVSSLCGNALIESLKHNPENRDEILKRIELAATYCSNRENMNYVDRDEILWAHAYRVRFFTKLVLHSNEFREKFTTTLADAVEDLESIQLARGTWYHEYANSFVTATALTALKCAERAGAEIDQDKIKSGVASLANDRFDNGAYPYYGVKSPRVRGSDDSAGTGQLPASAGRMPICELGLWHWGGSDDEKLQFALSTAFENHKHLAVGYKYDNHTNTMAYGGFFFWYDMRSRAEALSFMTPGETRTGHASTHRDLVLALPELDGCFVDSHELGRCYGTAMALLTLSILDEIDGK